MVATRKGSFCSYKEPSPVLKYYNIKEERTLQCDASVTGIGAVLLLEGQPIAYTL